MHKIGMHIVCLEREKVLSAHAFHHGIPERMGGELALEKVHSFAADDLILLARLRRRTWTSWNHDACTIRSCMRNGLADHASEVRGKDRVPFCIEMLGIARMHDVALMGPNLDARKAGHHLAEVHQEHWPLGSLAGSIVHCCNLADR